MDKIDLFNEKTMTTKEIAGVFKCSERTIQRYTKELFPNEIKNGIETRLNEMQVTAIKLTMEKNYSLDNVVDLPNSDLEMLLLQKKLDKWKDEKIEKLQIEIKQANDRILIDKPKVELYDDFIDIKDLHGMKEVSDILKIGRNTLFAILRERKVLNKENLPYSQYKEMGLFEVKIKPIPGLDKNKHVVLVTPKGLEYLRKFLKDNENNLLTN